jgi:hypothetical protein
MKFAISVCAAIVSAASVTLLGSTASAQTNLFTFHGEQASYGLGAAIVDAGDVDGDGVSDFLIGVPHETSHGTVRLISGATGALIYALHSPVPTGQFGFSAANIGDIDGDGIADFAIGDISAPGPLGATGGVYVFSGATGIQLYALYSSTSPSFFGALVAGVGDVDGDGVPDFLVTAGSDETTGFLGVSYLFSGASGTLLFTVTPPPGFSGYGSSVVGLGDVDGDGVPDFAAGAVADSNAGGTISGRVTVFSGATFAPIYSIIGPHEGATIGSSLARVEDVDGDGVPDLLIGAEEVTGLPTTGAAYLHSGATGALLFSFAGDSFGDRFGASVADLGDLDGDGWPDVGISARVGNYVKVYSGRTGAWLFTMRETNTGWMTPMAIVRLGDLNGDGHAEIAIGSESDSTNGQFSGRVRVMSNPIVPQTGVASCFGDGSAGPCPCGNSGASGAGCANATGHGAVLGGFGSTSVVDDLFYLQATQLPPLVLSVLFSGTNASTIAFGPAGDGLRCIGGTIKRVAYHNANQVGTIWFGPTMQPMGAWSPGETRYFQAFYRATQGPCFQGYNVSGAVGVVFTP